MIYFIVNNNYQYLDFKNHLSSFNEKDVTLIEIPHTLDKRENIGIRAVFRYPLSSRRGLMAQIVNFFFSIRRIDHDIVPTKEDVLFFYTEYEILNQYVAGCFKKIGARVYLIEDGGFGTYIPFRIIDSESLTVKEGVKQFIYRLLPGLSMIRLHKLNGHIFFWMPDSCIDGVCLYKIFAIERNIPVYYLERPFQPRVNTILGRVLFLNEPIYDGYQNAEEYLDGLVKIVDGLCNGFSEVFFKFHPRETEKWRERIQKEIFSYYPSVSFIEDDAAIEEIIERYCPSVAASYFCSALLSLCDRGIHPMYLYHLIPNLQNQSICQEITPVLEKLGYNFVSRFAEIDSSFQAGILDVSNYPEKIIISDLIDR